MQLILLIVLSAIFLQSSAYGQNLGLDYETPEGAPEKASVSRAAGGAKLYYTKHRLTIDFGDTLFVSRSSPFTGDIVYAGWKAGASVPTLIMIMTTGSVLHLSFNPATDKKYRIRATIANIAKRLNFENFGKILGDDLYAISYETSYISRDSSRSWQVNEAGLTDVSARYDLALDSSQNVWLGTGNGLFMQPLVSNTWSPIASAGIDPITQVFVDQQDRIWIKSYSALTVSLDGGSTFVDPPGGLPFGGFIRFGEDVYRNIYAITGMAPSLEGGSGVYKSIGGTAPFERIDGTLAPLFVQASGTPYLSVSGDSTVWLGTVAGTFRSSDQGSTWVYDPKHQADEIQSFVPHGSNGVIATSTGVFKRTATHEWQRVYPASGFESGVRLLSDPTGSMQYLVGQKLGQNTTTSPYYEIYRSSDFGSTWTIDTTGGSEIGMSQLYADGSGALHAIGHVDLIGVGPVIRAWKKPWGGQWALNMNGIPADLNFQFALQTIGGNSNTTYFAFQNTGQQRVNVYRQSVGSGTWEDALAGFNGIALRFSSAGSLQTLATAKGIAIIETGIRFLPLPSEIKLAELNYTMAAPSESGRIWAWFESFDETKNVAIGSGIYYTDDQQTWKKAVSNLDTIQMSQLIASGDSLFVITQVSGMYVVKAQTAGVATMQPITGSLRLSPNPASNKVRVAFNEENATQAAISIVDVTGKVIKTLDHKLSGSSLHEFDLDVHDLASGNYLINLMAGGVVFTGKFSKE